jgi:hypothetical protein
MTPIRRGEGHVDPEGIDPLDVEIEQVVVDVVVAVVTEVRHPRGVSQERLPDGERGTVARDVDRPDLPAQVRVKRLHVDW